MTVSLWSTTRSLLIAAASALTLCVPCWGQLDYSVGAILGEPGGVDQDWRRSAGDQGSDVVAVSWDTSSRLLQRNGPPSPDDSRPGFLGKLVDLARGRVMLEGGYAYVADSSAGMTIREHVVPDLLMRVGVTERIEVRIGWPGVSVVNQDGPLGSSTTTTTLDPNAGFMIDLWSQHAWLPQTAILGTVPITLGGNRFAMNSLQPLSAVLYQWHLTDRLAFGGDSGLAFFREAGDHYLQWQQSLDVDYLLTDRVGIFSQWQVLADDGSADDATRHMLSAGTSWLCTDRLQVTWRAGVGLNYSAPDLLTDIRFGFLF